MIVLLSPSKTSDPISKLENNFTTPIFQHETNELITILQKMNRHEVKTLMHISDKLADQTWERITHLCTSTNATDVRCAIHNYTGEVYVGLNAGSMDEIDLSFAQQHLRILSGLYGILKPLDMIQLYRLEMATALNNSKGKNLYQFWRDKITNAVSADLAASGSDLLINLASDEYFKCIDTKNLKATIGHFDFFEMKNAKKVFVSFSAKKARGLMANYIIKNKISTFEGLLDFVLEGYTLDTYDQQTKHLTFIKA